MPSLAALAEALRQTLCAIEQNQDLNPSGPGILEFKRTLRRRIAVLAAAAMARHHGMHDVAGQPPLGPGSRTQPLAFPPASELAPICLPSGKP